MFNYVALIRIWYGLCIAMIPSLTRLRRNNTKKPRRLVRLGCVCFRFLGFAFDFQSVNYNNRAIAVLKFFTKTNNKTKKIKKRCFFCQP